MESTNRYMVIRDSLAGITVLCSTGFKDVVELVANEAAKYLDEGFNQHIIIIDNVDGKHDVIA